MPDSQADSHSLGFGVGAARHNMTTRPEPTTLWPSVQEVVAFSGCGSEVEVVFGSWIVEVCCPTFGMGCLQYLLVSNPETSRN